MKTETLNEAQMLSISRLKRKGLSVEEIADQVGVPVRKVLIALNGCR